MSTKLRTPAFTRNTALEAHLAELNDRLAPVQDALEQAVPELPPVFIVGTPRGGTTLTLQWLAASGRFAYPSNLMSRFYRAPWVGAQVQAMLTEDHLQFRRELADVPRLGPERPVRSDIGKTEGMLSPHVFWYFWREFLPFAETSTLDLPRLARRGPGRFVGGVASIERALQKPVVMKAMIVNWDLPRVAAWFPRLVLLQVRRDPIDVMASVLRARVRFGGHEGAWWSFRPPEYAELVGLSPKLQVATFVWSCQHHIARALAEMPQSRHLTLDYHALCADPRDCWERLRERLVAQGHDPGEAPAQPVRFERRARAPLEPGERRALEAAWSTVCAERGQPGA